MPGCDPKGTKYLLCQLSLDHAHELVRQYGTRPRFGIMPLRWYQGHGVDDLPTRFEVYVSVEVRQKHVPFMFAYLLSIFWDLTPDGILTTQSGVAIQIVGYNKIRLGLSDEAHKTLVDMIDVYAAKYGLKFKDQGSGEFVNTSGDTYIQPPSEWGPDDYLFLINVPPWWGEKSITEILRASEVENLLVKRMRWSVGEIRTLTLKICIPSGDVPKLVGSVFRGAQDVLMQVISQPEYAAR